MEKTKNLDKTACAYKEIYEILKIFPNELVSRIPKEKNIAGSEMESFALFYTAKVLNRNAACLLTVVDSNVKKQNLTSEQRLKSLNEMIVLALETTLNL